MAYVAPYEGPYPPASDNWLEDMIEVLGVFLFMVYALVGSFAFMIDVVWLIELIGGNL